MLLCSFFPNGIFQSGPGQHRERKNSLVGTDELKVVRVIQQPKDQTSGSDQDRPIQEPNQEDAVTTAENLLRSDQCLEREHPEESTTTEQLDKVLEVSNTAPAFVLRSMSEPRQAKFMRLLNQPVVDVDALRELAWSGIPISLRPLCWKLLLNYLPPNQERRESVLIRKRREYKDLIPEYYDSAAKGISSSPLLNGPGQSTRISEEESALRQVMVDVPRTAPGVGFFHQPRMQKVLERILYIWGIRHPASGYVQGINDLATPFLAVFVSKFMSQPEDVNTWNLDPVTDDDLLDIEADCYWCLCKLLDGIQDHYTYSQPGIQRTLFHVRELVTRLESATAAHFEREGVEFMQFAFRWANCLLLRELPFNLGIRLWDTYLAEGAALKDFLVYVLSSFLLSWAPKLKTLEFQELIMFLQKVPTADWSESDVEMVLSRAFMWRASFKDASSHFATS
jgi:hypothetical protein